MLKRKQRKRKKKRKKKNKIKKQVNAMNKYLACNYFRKRHVDIFT